MHALSGDPILAIIPDLVTDAQRDLRQLQNTEKEANKYKVFGENYEPLSLALTIIITTVIIVVGALLSDKLIPTSIYENPIHRITISRTGIIMMSCAPLAVIIALAGCIWRDHKNAKWNEENLAHMAELKVLIRFENPEFRHPFNQFLHDNNFSIPPERLSSVVKIYDVYLQAKKEIPQIESDLKKQEQEFFTQNDAVMEGEAKMEGEGQEPRRSVNGAKIALGNRALVLEKLLQQKQSVLETATASIAAACLKENTAWRSPSPILSPGSTPPGSVVQLSVEVPSSEAALEGPQAALASPGAPAQKTKYWVINGVF